MYERRIDYLRPTSSSISRSDFQNTPLKQNRKNMSKRTIVPMSTSNLTANATATANVIATSHHKSPQKYNRRHPSHTQSNCETSSSSSSSRKHRTQENTHIHTHVEFQSILRIRPFTLEEKGDRNVFSTAKDDHTTIRMHTLKDRPTHSSMGRRQKDIEMNAPSEYHFDAVLNEDINQNQTYEHISGITMAQDAVRPLFDNSFENLNRQNCEAKQHVIVSIGVSNSGKTYTIFGDHKESKDEEGIVPRLIDDMFAVEEEVTMKRMSIGGECEKRPKFGVQLSMVHVHNDHIYDMLSNGDDDLNVYNKFSNKIAIDRGLRKRKSTVSHMVASFETRNTTYNRPAEQMKELQIKKDRNTNDFVINSSVVFCASSKDARETLYKGLENCTISATKLNKLSSRGHTMITLRPVIKSVAGDEGDVVFGGSINIIDMAGIERTKSSAVSGIQMRESASINTTISAVLNCLRTINDNCNNVNNNASSDSIENGDNIENISPAMNNNANGSFVKSTTKLQIVPYRQNNLTKLMQPLFSGNFDGRRGEVSMLKSIVKVLVSVYPGSNDYNEKKALLGEINSLRGLSTHRIMKRHLDFDTSSSIKRSIKTNVKISSPIIEASFHDCHQRTSPKQSANIQQAEYEYPSPVPKKFSSPLKMIAKAVKTSSSQKRKADEISTLIDKIRKLEGENEALLQDKRKSKEKISTLQASNERLLSQVERSKLAFDKLNSEMDDLKKKSYQNGHRKDTKASVQSYLITREIRWREQNLLSGPLREHMKAVECHRAVYSGNVKGMMMTNPPFKLCVPSSSANDPKATSPAKTNNKKHDNTNESDSSYSA